MQIDSEPDDTVISSLVVGFIKEESVSNKVLRFRQIIDLITTFVPETIINPFHNMGNASICAESMDIDDSKPRILKERNSVDASIFLIEGYVRCQSLLFSLSISTVIIDLIYQFYQKMGGSSFVWTISDKTKLLSKILNTASTADTVSFDSDVFDVSTKLKDVNTSSSNTNNNKICGYCNNNGNGYCCHCNEINKLSLLMYLKLYPNGTNADSRGELQLAIFCVSLPSKIECVSFTYQIYCNEIPFCWSAQCDHNNYEEFGKARKCLSPSPISTYYIKTLYELNKINKLTFYCTFDIINIVLKDTKITKYNPTYYFDEKEYLDSYQGAIFSKFVMKNDQYKFKWNINEDQVKMLTSCNMDKCILSDTYYDIWALSLHHKKVEPQETKSDDNTDDDDDMKDDIVTVGVQLCALPSNLSSIMVQIKLNCLQSSSSWSIIKKFTPKYQFYSGQDTDIIIKSKYINLKQLTLVANIIVIEAFNENGQEMSSSIQQQLQDNNDKGPFHSIGYKFEPLLSGDLNKRYYYQHICIAKDDQFDSMSPEEIQFQDREKQPISWSTNMTQQYNRNERIGTTGWVFKPHQYILKNNKKYYYQHICVGDVVQHPFINKSSEELRFEDQYQYQNNRQWKTCTNEWSWNNAKTTGSVGNGWNFNMNDSIPEYLKCNELEMEELRICRELCLKLLDANLFGVEYMSSRVNMQNELFISWVKGINNKPLVIINDLDDNVKIPFRLDPGFHLSLRNVRELLIEIRKQLENISTNNDHIHDQQLMIKVNELLTHFQNASQKYEIKMNQFNLKQKMDAAVDNAMLTISQNNNSSNNDWRCWKWDNLGNDNKDNNTAWNEWKWNDNHNGDGNNNNNNNKKMNGKWFWGLTKKNNDNNNNNNNNNANVDNKKDDTKNNRKPTDEEKLEYKSRLIIIYEQCNKEKLKGIDMLITKYSTSLIQLHAMYVKCCKKYNVEPQEIYTSKLQNTQNNKNDKIQFIQRQNQKTNNMDHVKNENVPKPINNNNDDKIKNLDLKLQRIEKVINRICDEFDIKYNDEHKNEEEEKNK